MDKPDYSDIDAEIIDITPRLPQLRRKHGRIKWAILAVLILLIAALRGISIYTDELWYDSLGFGSRFWYVLGLGWGLFAVFGILTLVILGGGFFILQKWFRMNALVPRRIVVNKQPVNLDLSRYLRPIGWIIAIAFGMGSALKLSADWQAWVLYLHQPATAMADPIFGRFVGFYLFSLPIYELIAGWLTTLAVILLVAAVVCSLITAVPDQIVVDEKRPIFTGFGKRSYTAVSALLGVLLLIVALRTMLSRYAFLWTDHSSFSGVTYTEANYVLPGLTALAIALAAAAILLFVNAFTKRNGRLMLVAIGAPILVYLVAVALIPAYVQSFIVKPNELDRETPYIEHNIAGTRTGFNIDNVQVRDYAADITPAAFDLAANRGTLTNIRLWDWNALQDTLRQIQEIRTYYDFPDVDVDRYKIGGEMRQVMVATREFDINKLPEQSRNWINERLVYTHGYGLTMNPVNEFTNEGKPRFVLSNMPINRPAT